MKSLESGLEERRREEEVSARLQQLIQVRVRSLKHGPKKGENMTTLLSGFHNYEYEDLCKDGGGSYLEPSITSDTLVTGLVAAVGECGGVEQWVGGA